MKEYKKKPIASLLILGIALIFFSSVVDEYLQKKWFFYLMVGTGLFACALAILRTFSNMNRNYLDDIHKLKQDKKDSDDNQL